jgi:hypothetical protein
MSLLVKSIINYFKKSFNFSSGEITKNEYITGIVLSWLLFKGVSQVKTLLKKSEECDVSANKFCGLEVQFYNGFLELVVLPINLYIIIALAALVNRELIAIGKFKHIFKNSFIIRNVFVGIILLFFQGLAPLLFAILYFIPRETEKNFEKHIETQL